jgi:MFS transporter, PPP family, 3-phenylpropionic acid transporter
VLMRFLLAGFYFFYFAIIGIYVIFMPKILEMVGYSGVDIGIIFAIAPLVRFLVPFAFFKGLKLNRGIFNLALFSLLISSLLFFVTIHNFYALLFTNILLGIGLSLVLPYVEVIALHVITKEHYGKVRLFGSIGFIVVALVLVRYLSGVATALSFLLFVTVFTVLFGYFLVQKEPSEIHTQEQRGSIEIRSHWSLWVGLALMQMSFGPFYNFFTIYETANGISLNMSVYLWSFGVIIEIVMLLFQGRLLRKNLLFIIQITVFSAVIRWFLLFVFPNSLFISFFTQSLHALSFALFHSAAISYLFTLYTQKRLAQQFYLGVTYGLGGFLGALYSGYVYEYFPSYLFLSAALIALVAFGFVRYEAKLKENPIRF